MRRSPASPGRLRGRERWVVGRVNDQYVKVAKLLGQLVWHAHDEEVVLTPGQFYVVPRGVQHNPIADDEMHVVLIETVTTAHTGDVVVEGTVSLDEQVGNFR
ncbi:cupin domain-containing protein [Saccharothrix syringae]|uniref:Cupin domain-containing protein n=1 Tax=Saccharothrix syringae TaxID=103733 RepID=A0A5Q0GZ18_SACSY|nr:cupin [Saccharothrix syringae]QFZ18622.1 cupin domain-containing protein [Saccharothrix syringae]